MPECAFCKASREFIIAALLVAVIYFVFWG